MSLESVFRLSLIMNLIDNLTGPMAGVTSSVDGTVSKLQKVNSTLGSVAKTGAVMQEDVYKRQGQGRERPLFGVRERE